MAIIDNTLAAQVPQLNPATPLMQAAQIQNQQAEAQAAQFKQKQNAVGAEMRGVAPFVNTPEFPARWAQAADTLLKNGVIDQQTHQQIVNSPSPLMLKSIIAKTESPEISLRKQEDAQAQGNSDRTFAANRSDTKFNQGIASRAADRADQTPLEAMQERAPAAEAAGLEPGSPAYTSYSLTGKFPDAALQPEGSVKSLTPGGELYHLEGGKVVVDHKNDKGVNAEDVSQETVNYLADRSRMGDPAVKVGYARNPGMIARIDAAARQREADRIPISDEAKNVTNNKVTLSARGSAERRLGTINTNNEFYGNNALGAIDIAEKASAALPRTEFYDVNKLLNAYRTKTGNKEVVELGGAINTLINDYAKFTGGGTPTDALRHDAKEMISGAHSDDQFKGIAHMMRLEIERGKKSPGMVREGLDALYAPHGTQGSSKPTPSDRFKQLIGTGASKEDAYAKMHEEGY